MSENGLLPYIRMIVIVTAGLFTVSCGKSKVPDQAIVVGDSFEITVPELEQVLRAAPAVRREQVAPARRALLDALIGQKLLAEAADKDGLSERPVVVQQLTAARRAILANAYIKKINSDDEKIAGSDVSKYYQDHPGRFGQRSIITINEYVLPLGNKQLSAYTKILNDRGFDALKSVLSERLPDLASRSRMLASSDLPISTEGAASRLKVGNDVAYRTADALHLGQVVAIQPQPISVDDAREGIIGLIREERRAALVSAAVDDLKRDRHVRIVNADLSKVAVQ